MILAVPENILFLAHAVGEDAALQFVEQLAGQSIWVPQRPDGNRIERLYGDGIARALCAAYGGEYWSVPVCRHWRIHKYAAMGLTINEIVSRSGVAKRAVYDWLAKPYNGRSASRPRPVDDRQATLF